MKNACCVSSSKPIVFVTYPGTFQCRLVAHNLFPGELRGRNWELQEVPSVLIRQAGDVPVLALWLLVKNDELFCWRLFLVLTSKSCLSFLVRVLVHNYSSSY